MTQNRNDPQRGWQPRATWIALAAIWCAVFIDLNWIFALLLVGWGLYDVFTGQSLFVQRVTRRHQPVTYWLVVSTWILLGVLWLIYEG